MSQIRICQLDIHNIGAFGDFRMTFPEKPAHLKDKAEIHIFTGENGTGKSTLLELLTLSISSDNSIFANKSRFKDERSNHEIKYSGNNWAKWASSKGFNFAPSLLKPQIMYEGSYTIPISLAYFAYSGYRIMQNVQTQAIKEITEPPLSKASDFKQSVDPTQIIQWIANTISKEAIAKMQNQPNVAQRYRQALSRIELAIGKIIEKDIRFMLEFEPMEVKVRVEQEVLNFNQLPDGLKSIISWLSDLLMRMDRVQWVKDTPVFERNFLLFLDEIEVHLHPAWQRKILPVVQSLFPNAQIFVSSHSPFVVGSVDGAWIHKLVKPNGDTQLQSPVLSEDAKSYRYWLNEIFDIKASFGGEAQSQLDAFYKRRDMLLKQENEQNRLQFQQITTDLKQQNSIELDHILVLELRQLNKRLSKPILI
jgi:predicted ATP-binding protein involved in virulence